MLFYWTDSSLLLVKLWERLDVSRPLSSTVPVISLLPSPLLTLELLSSDIGFKACFCSDGLVLVYWLGAVC